MSRCAEGGDSKACSSSPSSSSGFLSRRREAASSGFRGKQAEQTVVGIADLCFKPGRHNGVSQHKPPPFGSDIVHYVFDNRFSAGF